MGHPPQNFSFIVSITRQRLAAGSRYLLAKFGRVEDFDLRHPTEDEAHQAAASRDAHLDGRGLFSFGGFGS